MHPSGSQPAMGQTRSMIRKIDAHKKYINDLQYSKDFSMFITASKDQSAKVQSNFFILLRRGCCRW